MHLAETIERLAAIQGRGAGTDAERRAAVWLARDVAGRGHPVWTDVVWLRPGWAWPVALASLCLALEGGGLTSPLRLLTRRRATQCVVSLPEEDDGVTLIVTAPYDAPLRGLVLNDRWRAAAARLGDLRPWLAGCALVIAGAAGGRLAGVDAAWLGV